MVAPSTDKELLLYLTTLEEAIGVLITQEVEGQERPIYYLSRLLKGPEQRYSQLTDFAWL